MPLSLRSVEPVDVSLNRIPDPQHRRPQIDELQTIANGTMANLMRQMSNLSDHIAHLMSDLNDSAVAIDRRMETLATRTARLHEKYEKGGGFGSHVGGLGTNHLRKAFQTAQVIDQHSLARQTLPAAMAELYNRCDPPPCLNQLNEFRDDGKAALKFYTDPGYFFDLWKEQILRECENDRRMRSARAHAAAQNLPATGSRSPQKRRKPPPGTQRAPQTANVLLGHFQSSSSIQMYGDHRTGGLLMPGAGEFMQFPTEYQAPQFLRNAQPGIIQAPPGMSRPQLRTPSAAVYDDEPLPPPPMTQHLPADPTAHSTTYRPPTVIPSAGDSGTLTHEMSRMNVATRSTLVTTIADPNVQFPHIDDDDDDLPPPPAPLLSHGLHFLPPGASMESNGQFGVFNYTPAPPSGSSTALPANLLTESTLTVQSSFQRVPTNGDELNDPTTVTISSSTTVIANPAISDETRRPTLLDQIQAGMQLKKVQRQVEAERSRAAFDNKNVAEILMQRRINMNGGAESSSSSEKAENEDDDEWDDA